MYFSQKLHFHCCIFVKSDESNISISSDFEIYQYFIYLPAIRPTSGRSMGPEISHKII